MTAIHWIIAVVALAFVQQTPVSAAQTDPEIIIYRFPGVRDDGGAVFAGTATVFHCTNFSGVDEIIRWVTRDTAGGLLDNTSFGISHLRTITVGTHINRAYWTVTLSTGLTNQRTTAIPATSSDIIRTE